MSTFAYCRVSTTEQNTYSQKEAIRSRYPEAIIREEKASGTTRSGRPVLELLLDMVGADDKLVVWKLDRLARNLLDLQQIVNALERKGANLEVLDQQINTATASGRAFLQMLGVFAEFENNLRRERQIAGIARAKEIGKFKGSKPRIDRAAVQQLTLEGHSPTQISKQLNVSRQSVYRILRE